MQTASDYNALAQKLFVIVKKHICFPQAILTTQFKRINKTAQEIAQEDIPVLASCIGGSVANFTNPDKGQEVEKAILELKKE